MLPEHEILLEDETITGRYNAEIARWSNNRWISTIPPIYLFVTTQRVILQPQTRKNYQPAAIPGKGIRSVKPLNTQRQGIMLHLKDDFSISLFVKWKADNNLLERIQTLAEIRTSRPYQLPLSSDYLQKMIEFMEGL
ncbi:MAG: hypothetical protein H7Y11_09580 [Armatimonadetes bacterium]|nr:hypothetical protein [Anaerolineae bacterium]